MSKEADARRARRERIAALDSAQKQQLVDAYDAAHADDDVIEFDPIMDDLLGALIASLAPAQDNPTARALIAETQDVRRMMREASGR